MVWTAHYSGRDPGSHVNAREIQAVAPFDSLTLTLFSGSWQGHSVIVP